MLWSLWLGSVLSKNTWLGEVLKTLLGNLFFFLFFLYIYNRNSNLNSYTRIFEDPEDWTHTLIEEWGFLGTLILGNFDIECYDNFLNSANICLRRQILTLGLHSFNRRKLLNNPMNKRGRRRWRVIVQKPSRFWMSCLVRV